jgi:DNA-binding PadR family transcriptional regulator
MQDHLRTPNGAASHASRFGLAPPRRFVLPAILLLLSEQPGYGYSLQKDLQEFRFGDIDRANIYRALAQLEADGLVQSRPEAPKAGQARRVYGVTPLGERVLREWMSVIKEERDCLGRVLRRYQSTRALDAVLAEVEGGWAATLGFGWSPVSSVSSTSPGRRPLAFIDTIGDPNATADPNPSANPKPSANPDANPGADADADVDIVTHLDAEVGAEVGAGVGADVGAGGPTARTGTSPGVATPAWSVSREIQHCPPDGPLSGHRPAAAAPLGEQGHLGEGPKRFSLLADRSVILIEVRSTVGPISFGGIGVTGSVTADIVDGTLRAGSRPEAHLEVAIDGLRSGNRVYDAELLRRVDARRFPTAAVDLRTCVPGGSANCYRLAGDLNFHGVTRSAQGTVTVEIGAESRLVVTGEQLLDIRDFDVASPTVLMLRIYPDVRVRLHVEAVADADADADAEEA